MRDDAQKLQEGLKLLERADNDQELIGAALLKVHGACEDRLRNLLETCPGLSPEQCEQLGRYQDSGMVWLVDRALEHRLLDADVRKRILEANDVRQRFAHGGPLATVNGATWDRQQVIEYSRFVAALCSAGEPATQAEQPEQTRTPPAAQPQPGEPGARQAVPPPPPASTPQTAPLPSQEWKPPRARRAAREMLSAGLVSRLLLLIAIVVVWVFIREIYFTQRATVNRAPAVAVPTPVLPTPTTEFSTLSSTRQQARITQIGAGQTGQLRIAPDSPVSVGAPVRDGDVVQVQGQSASGADGRVWYLVSHGDATGWVPRVNLEFLP